MTCYIEAPYNIQEESDTFYVRIEDSSTHTVNTYNSSSGYFFPVLSASIEDIYYSSSLGNLVSWLNTLSATYGSWTGSHDPENNKITLTNNGGALTSFSMSALTSRVLGIYPLSGAYYNTLTSSRKPFYTFNTTYPWSKVSNIYTDDKLVYADSCDDGKDYQISVEASYSPISLQLGNFDKIDFSLIYESKAKMFSDYSSSLVPYTWQQHMTHVRAGKPWVFFTQRTSSYTYDDRYGTMKFQGNSTKFTPEKSFSSLATLFNHTVKTRLISTGSDFSTIS